VSFAPALYSTAIPIDPKTGLFDPESDNAYQMSITEYLETIGISKCANCGQFTKANANNHDCDSTQPYDTTGAIKGKIAWKKAETFIASQAADNQGTWTGGAGTYVSGFPTLGQIDAISADGTPITITAFQNGMWAWNESSGPESPHPHVYTEPEYALANANLIHSPSIKNVTPLNSPFPYELPGQDEKSGTVNVNYSDVWATVCVVTEKHHSGAYVYTISNTAKNPSTIMTGTAKNYSDLKAVVDMNLKNGLGRCGECGQFISIASAGSHVCPEITPVVKKIAKKKAVSPIKPHVLPALPVDAQVDLNVAGDISSKNYLNVEETPAPVLANTGDATVDLAVEQVAGSSLSGQEALDYQASHGNEVVTPIPESGELKAGDGVGQHLVIGGSDFYDSAVTLISYKDSLNPENSARQVLFAEVTPEAEIKMIESLSTDMKMIEKTTEVTEVGRHPVDVENSLYDEIYTASKSINFHLKEQDEIPEGTLQTISGLETKISNIKTDYEDNQEVQTMLASYSDSIKNLKTWRDNWDDKKSEFSSKESKLPKVSEFNASHTYLKTEMVPTPGGDGLAVTIKNVASISPTLMPNGESHWDGSVNGSLGGGSQYEIDLGDGYTAYYRPHNGDHLTFGSPQKGSKGQLEVVAPAGVDNPEQLTRVLSRMHLSHQPLRQSEAEWSYLNANIFSQDLGGRAGIQAARASGELIIGARNEQIMAARMNEMMDLDDAGMNQWIKSIRIQAERDSLNDRTAILREAVAKASGFTGAASMLKSSNYAPAPRLTRAGIKWQRFDVTSEDIDVAWGQESRGLVHSVSGHSERILDILATGTLASQSRRRRIGVAQTGMSEAADIDTGGSRFVFLRNGFSSQKYSGAGLVWEKPGAVLSRTDWYANAGDKYGAISKNRNPLKTVSFTDDKKNEIMVNDGIDIYGTEAPSRVHVPSNLREKALAIVAGKGITNVNGVPVEKWIVS
jgi:hypothetical protein